MKWVNTRTDLLRLLPQGLVIAELGVFIGDFSKTILEICNPKLFLGVDTFPYAPVYSGDKDGRNRIDVPDLSIYFEILKERYKNDKRVIFTRCTTDVFAHLAVDYNIDVTYIDSDHSYDSVLSDLYNYYSIMKSGGFILGHDYDQSGVKAAVDLFCKEKGLKISYLTKDLCPSYLIEIL